MTNQSPVTVESETDPTTPENTVITARFNRKKIVQIAGTATAALGALFIFGAVQKERGKAELIQELVDNQSDDPTDETTES